MLAQNELELAVSRPVKRLGRVKGFRLNGKHTEEYYRLTGQKRPNLHVVGVNEGKALAVTVKPMKQAAIDLYEHSLKYGGSDMQDLAKRVLDQALLG